MSLHTYLPQDRLRALSRGETLPDRTTGSALFADISGFTPLTELLHETLGARGGGEEMSKHLGIVYTALINEVEKYGGSVINFAGDSITCWFDDANGPAAPRAVSAAFALQVAMNSFSAVDLPNGTITALTLKVAIATGPARRFVVGDPIICYVDAIAGATVARTATAEHLAIKRDVLVDEATVNALGDKLTIQEWRADPESQERFAVVTNFASDLTAPALPVTTRPPAANKLRAWMHDAVYDREQEGEVFFLTDFRPCAVLFVRFMGIDYDADVAEKQLDDFFRQIQHIVARYEGAVLQLTIGDKGSYAHINFGALVAHEDSARRAVKTAIELRKSAEVLSYLAPLQLGVTQGILRLGAYGGETRQTFGALGDEVNLAARLMTTAAPNEILVSGLVYNAVEKHFSTEPRAPVHMKGKTEPLPVFAIIGQRNQRSIRWQEPRYALPMVGRVQELRIINDKLDLVENGHGQVIGIVAEAGMGKSRLVAEVIRLARKKGFVGYGGVCQSDAVNTPYQAWKPIWQAFFDVDPEMPLKRQMRLLEGDIEDRAPERVQAMPLLNIVLDLEIPDNDFTATLEPRYRKSALRALLEDCLRAAAQGEPLLIVIEDLHWIDALSHDLLEELARDLSDSAVCFVLAYRPPQLARLEAPRLEGMPNFTKIELQELNHSEAEQAIRAKLAQLYPARGGALPGGLVDKLMARAQGNPFYLEELLNYLHDRSIDPSNLHRIELPDSLHTLILSRIDQLSEREKNTLRVASIVGRLFRAKWLMGYYPELGGMNRVETDLEQLARMDITPLDSPQPELAYLFKHIVTHEVTYESLPFATRSKLHEQLAKYLEGIGAAADTIAFHYGRSDNTAKKQEYYQKAADAAQAVSAYHAAAEYLTRLLELTPVAVPTRCAMVLKLVDIYRGLGDFPAALDAVAQAQAGATTAADRAAALVALSNITSNMGDYTEAQTILAQAVPLARASGDGLILCRALYEQGTNAWSLGNLDEAKAAQEESLALARTLGHLLRELSALTGLGMVALSQGALIEAERIFGEVRDRAVVAGNRNLAMTALNNLGAVAYERKEYASAQAYTQQALALAREIGAQDNIALYLINLADVNIRFRDLPAARTGLREGLTLAFRLGSAPRVVTAVMYLARLAYAEGQSERALALLGLAHSQPAWSSYDQYELDTALDEWALDPVVVEAGLKAGAALDWDATIQELLNG